MPNSETCRLAAFMRNVGSSPLMDLVKRAGGGSYINLASGMPDPSLFPAEALKVAADRVLTDDWSGALQYGPTEGYGPLREWIADRLRSFGIRASASTILVTNGSEQALDIVARAHLDPGDAVCVENPTYAAGLQTFDSCQATYRVVPQDDDGMFVSHARDALNTGCKLLLSLPNFQNPTGRSLSKERRLELASAIADSTTVLIEDDAYHDLRYDGDELPPICSLPGARNSFYLGSFSKNISPGLRVGYVHGPAEVIDRLSQLKQVSDLHTSSLTQRIVHRFVTGGDFHEHVTKLRDAYRAKRDAMLDCLARSMPDGVTWTKPAGGMFIWLSLPAEIDADILVDRAMQTGVLVVPGGAFSAHKDGVNAIRLNFVSAAPDQIEKGIEVLSASLKQ